ncbi:hypothetical protein EYF80_060483 [Liparis tanakae]|uniref:Uncharacterized protein n=1 Tax=Liparis tanakae TaxID=230148 RepID=A0A4Z2EKN0_9TELE|nr:hypothetical protein EYF80_060483 [Liparis tanakae]
MRLLLIVVAVYLRWILTADRINDTSPAPRQETNLLREEGLDHLVRHLEESKQKERQTSDYMP